MKNFSHNIKVNLPLIIVSFIYSFCILTGISFDHYESFGLFTNSFSSFIVAFVLFLAIGALFSVLLPVVFSILSALYKSDNDNITTKKSLLIFGVSSFIILLCYAPYLLSSFPGSINSDSINQYQIALGIDSFTNHHPFFVTYLLKWCLQAGSKIAGIRGGVFLYVCLQTVLLSLSFGNIIRIMYKLHTPKFITLSTFIFYCIFPLWGGYAQLVIKDTIYTAVLVTFFGLFIELILDKNAVRSIPLIICFALSGILTILTRNNGVYVVIPTCIACIICVSGVVSKVKLSIIALVFLILQASIGSIILPSLNIEKGSVKEALSIPFQQTARYVTDHGNEVTPEEKAAIDGVLAYDKLSDNYVYYGADPVKNTYHADGPYEKTLLSEYLKVWAKMFFKHPGSYISATVAGTYYYYAPNSTESFEPPFVYFVSDTNTNQSFFVEQNLRFEPLKVFLVSNSDNFRNLPVLGLLYRLGFYTFLLLGGMAFLIANKKYAGLVTYIPAVLSILICIASPVNGSYRYFLPVIGMVPLIISTTLKVCVKDYFSTMEPLILWFKKVTANLKSDKVQNVLPYIAAGLTGILWLCMTLNANVEYDGGYTVSLVRHSVKEIIDITSVDVHSPLYYMIAKAGYHLFGGTIQGIKLSSFIICTGYIFIGLYPLRKEFGSKFSTYFLLISGCMPGLIFHVSDARMYGMALTSVTAVGMLALLIYKNSGKLLYWFLFAPVSIFAMYIHTFAMLDTFIIYIMLLLALIVSKAFKSKKVLISYGINGVIVCLSYIPWLTVLASQMGTRKNTYGTVIEKTTIFSIWNYLEEYFTSINNHNLFTILLYVSLIVISLVLTFKSKKACKKYILAGFLVFILINTIGHLVSVLYIPCFIGRYAIPTLGFVCALLAFGISEINDYKLRILIIGIIMLFGVFTYTDYYNVYADDSGLQEYIDYMEANTDEQDAVIYFVIHTNYLTVYCPDRINFIYGYKDVFNPFPNYDVFTDFEQLKDLTGDIYFVGWTKDDYANTFSPFYSVEEQMTFKYMYYDFALYKLNKN